MYTAIPAAMSLDMMSFQLLVLKILKRTPILLQ